jgi:hypothetical protein
MLTECTPKRFEFEAVARRAVVACFDANPKDVAPHVPRASVYAHAAIGTTI